MIDQTITVNAKFIKFVNTCFASAEFETQHNQYDVGQYRLDMFIYAFDLYCSDDHVFHHNCHDCSYPKFKDVKTDKVMACPCCGD